MGMGITAVKLTALGRPQLLVGNFVSTVGFNLANCKSIAVKKPNPLYYKIGSIASATFLFFIFQLQLSEVIMRARQYMSDVVGGEGAVLAHHAKPDDFMKKFEEAHIKDAAPVQKFLQKMQSDKEGYVGSEIENLNLK